MAYIGFVGAGHVGNFPSLGILENLYPAQRYAGRKATIETAGQVQWYFSNGSAWTVLGIPPNMIQFASRTGTASRILSNASSFTDVNTRCRFWNRSQSPISQIVFRFANHVAASANLNNGTVAVTLQLGLAYPDAGTNPTRVPVTWDAGGTVSKTLAGGQVADTYSLTLATPIQPGESFSLFMNEVFASAPSVWPCSGVPSTISTYDVNEASATPIASKALAGAISGRDVAAHVMLPIAIYGRPVSNSGNGPLILVQGDSVAYGANDSTTGTGATGFVQRALLNSYPYSTAAQAGYALYVAFPATTPNVNTPPSTEFLRKMAPYLANGFTHVLMCLGGNDVKDGQTGLQVYTRMLAAKTYFDSLGMKLIVMTGLPRTNSTNDGLNASDDPGAMAQYIDMTTRVRAGNGVGYGYFDRMALMCTPGDETRWDPAVSTDYQDGIHPNTLRHTILADALLAAAPTLFT